MSQVQGFMAERLRRFSQELAEKYGVSENEIEDIVDSYLNDTYGAAATQAQAICDEKVPVILFIGKPDCAICQKSQPNLEQFLRNHDELKFLKIDYSQPEGILYHMIVQEDQGVLPLIAMIYKGHILMMFTGRCITPGIYEKYYGDLQAECSQNIYAL